jgi:hypothetical protein
MEGSAIAPPHQVAQVRWLIAAMLLGAAGSLVAISAFGSAPYRVGPIVMEMKMRPSTSGTTELAVNVAGQLTPGFTEANTHTGFLTFRGTVISVVGETSRPDALLTTKDPYSLATFMKEEGGTAIRKFILRIGLLTLAGGAAGGMAVAAIGMRARRILQGMVAGVVLVGALGAIAYQTYDIEAFKKVQFRTAGSVVPGG